MDFNSLLELGYIIDKAIDENNEEELNTIITIHSEYSETLNDSIEKCYSYYLLGNAYSGLRDITHTKNQDNIWKLEQEEVFKEIYYFRKAIQLKSFENLDIQFRLSIYTNLANVFNHYGRCINALKFTKEALSLNKNFFMALNSQAKCLETYAMLNYDNSHKDLFLRQSYFDYKKACESIKNFLQNTIYDLEYYNKVKEYIEYQINNIEQYLTIDWLNSKIDLNDFQLRKYKNEVIYRKWVLNNTLFLNPINDLGEFSVATYDILNLPNITTNKLELPIYITYFNQIKQEFISYRHLLFEGINSKTQRYYDKDTSITDDYDYNLYNIDIEKIKLSFRGFYSIFDKLAYFINEYFELGLNKKSVYFSNIWFNKLKKNGPKKTNDILNQSENIALRGLYLISKDLYFKSDENKEYGEVLEPKAKKINEIRNHLEHKFMSIKVVDVEKYGVGTKRDRNFYILEDDLIDTTIYLAQIVREAIIYLSFAVHIEENKKDKSEKYLSIPLKSK